LADGLKGRDGDRFRHDVVESGARSGALEGSKSVYRSSARESAGLRPPNQFSRELSPGRARLRQPSAQPWRDHEPQGSAVPRQATCVRGLPQ
jgi:hypothetical protein